VGLPRHFKYFGLHAIGSDLICTHFATALEDLAAAAVECVVGENGFLNDPGAGIENVVVLGYVGSVEDEWLLAMFKVDGVGLYCA
jgi:hypothetical protein